MPSFGRSGGRKRGRLACLGGPRRRSTSDHTRSIVRLAGARTRLGRLSGSFQDRGASANPRQRVVSPAGVSSPPLLRKRLRASLQTATRTRRAPRSPLRARIVRACGLLPGRLFQNWLLASLVDPFEVVIGFDVLARLFVQVCPVGYRSGQNAGVCVSSRTRVVEDTLSRAAESECELTRTHPTTPSNYCRFWTPRQQIASWEGQDSGTIA